MRPFEMHLSRHNTAQIAGSLPNDMHRRSSLFHFHLLTRSGLQTSYTCLPILQYHPEDQMKTKHPPKPLHAK